MKNKTSRMVKFVYFIVAMVALAIVVFEACTKTVDQKLLIESVKPYNEGWTYYAMDEKGNQIGEESLVTLPFTAPKDQRSKSSAISIQLPRAISLNSYLLLRQIHTDTVVYVGDMEIYRYEGNTNTFFPTPGCNWDLLRLNSTYSGQVLTIIQTAEIDRYQSNFNSIKMGSYSALIIDLIGENLIGLIISLIILTAGIVFLAAFLYIRKSNFLYLAELSFLVFLWSINETTLLQLISGNNELVSTGTFMALTLIPLPLLCYMGNSKYEVLKKIYKYLWPIPVIDFTICAILNFTKIADFMVTMPYSMLSMVCITLVIIAGYLYELIKEFGARNKHKKELESSVHAWTLSVVGFFLLVVLILVDVVRYLSGDFFGDSARYSKLGLLIYLLTLGVESMKQIYNENVEKNTLDFLSQMAYKDVMTGLPNRAAYEEAMTHIDESPTQRKITIGVMIDLNNLKKINDVEGHEEGDAYIKENADFIVRTFHTNATCFRVGGDEFAVLYTALDKEPFFESLKTLANHEKNGEKGRIDFAMGYAVFDSTLDQRIQDTMRRADMVMYQQKRLKKVRQAEEAAIAAQLAASENEKLEEAAIAAQLAASENEQFEEAAK